MDKNLIYVIKSSRGRYLERLTLLNDRDKRLVPFVLVYETKNKSQALKFDSDQTAQEIADFLNDTKDDNFYLEPVL